MKFGKWVCIISVIVGFNFLISLPRVIAKHTILDNCVRITVVYQDLSESSYFVDKTNYNNWLLYGDDLNTKFDGAIPNEDIKTAVQIYSQFCEN